MYTRKVFRKSLLCIFIMLGIALTGITKAVIFSTKYDPFAFHHPLEYLPKPNPARGPLADYSYVAKTADIIRYKPEHIIVGSSVADNAFRIYGSAARWFDPDPEKTRAIFAAVGGDDSYYNAAVRGAGLKEAAEYIEHAYANNPHVSKVILGAEWHLFTEAKNNARRPGISHLDYTYMPVDYYMQYTISPLALEKAYGVFIQENLGFYQKLQRFLHPFRHETVPPAFVPDVPLFKEHYPYELQQFVFSLWFINNLAAGYEKNGLGIMHKGAFADVRRSVEFCGAHHIDFTLYLSPQHPLFWAMMRRYRMQPAIDYWLREIVKAAPAWDFSMMVDYDNPNEKFGVDTMHITAKGGEIMFPLLHRYGQENKTAARKVTTENVEEIIAWRKKLLNDWLAAHADLARTVDAIPTERLIHSDITTLPLPDTMMPVLYKPAYKEYNIIKFAGLYYALPETIKPPYDLYAFLQKKYTGMRDADSLEEIKAQIDKR